MHDGFDLPTDGVLRLQGTHHRVHAHEGESELRATERRTAELDATITEVGADRVCAMIGEPVIGSGGAVILPRVLGVDSGGAAGARRAVDRRRDHHRLRAHGRVVRQPDLPMQPDLLTMAKQLTSAHFPISAVAIHDDFHGEILAQQAHDLGTLGHGFTYGGHPVGAAVALETLRIYDGMDLPNHISDSAPGSPIGSGHSSTIPPSRRSAGRPPRRDRVPPDR